MRITVTVKATLESDGEGGAPVAEQTFYRLELDPAFWATAVTDLGQAALTDVARMISVAITSGQPPPVAIDPLT